MRHFSDYRRADTQQYESRQILSSGRRWFLSAAIPTPRRYDRIEGAEGPCGLQNVDLGIESPLASSISVP